MRRSLPIVLCVVFVAGLLGAGVAAAQEYALKDYMPQAVGSTWTMKTTRGDESTTITVEITETRDIEGQQVPLAVTKNADGVATRGSLELVTEDKWTIFGGMFRGRDQQGELQPRLYTPPMEFPGKMTVGQTAEATLKMTRGDREFESTTKIELAAVEAVTVAKGTFEDCLKLVTTRSFGRGEMATTTWYAKGVGEVKSERPGRGDRPGTTTELVDYKLAE
jgi:hypothetical protein